MGRQGSEGVQLGRCMMGGVLCVPCTPALFETLHCEPLPLLPALQITFSLVVTNAGDQAMTGTTLTDDLPEGLEALSVEPTETCQLARGGATITCDLGTIAPGGSVVVTIIAKATRPVRSFSCSACSVEVRQAAFLHCLVAHWPQNPSIPLHAYLPDCSLPAILSAGHVHQPC